MMPIHWGATDGRAQPISRPDEVAQVCGELGGANGVLCGELKIGQVVVDQGTIHLSNVAMGETGTRGKPGPDETIPDLRNACLGIISSVPDRPRVLCEM
jgi:hypothetical protein